MQDGSSGHVEKQSVSGYIQKVELTGPVDVLDMGTVRAGEAQHGLGKGAKAGKGTDWHAVFEEWSVL